MHVICFLPIMQFYVTCMNANIIGAQCPAFCSGHGRCSRSNGQYQGVVCGGNSDGQPCAPSYTVGTKTYTGCIRDGRNDNELWCSTTSDYDKDKKWGFCICGKINIRM